MADAAKKKILTYLVLAFALSSIFYWLILSGRKGGGLLILGLMWCPGVAALATRLFYQKDLRGMGWGWGKTRYQVLSYVLPLLGALLVYGTVWLTGFGGFSDAALTMKRPLAVSLFLMATVGFLINVVFALGEEIGWRGLLVPELSKVTGFGGVGAISGAVWVLYHYPLILFGDYHSTAPKWWALVFFTIGIWAGSFAFAWFRLKSGSLWTAVILHASHNVFIQQVFDPMMVDRGRTQYVTTEFGLGMALFYLAAAWICWRRRGELANEDALSPATGFLPSTHAGGTSGDAVLAVATEPE
jgi:membrane protease YdiL (CAAX protease family)